MWDTESRRLIEASGYALLISRKLLLDFQRGPAAGIYNSRLDIRQCQSELAPRNVKGVTQLINRERQIVAHVP